MFQSIMVPVDLAHLDQLTRAREIAAGVARQSGATVTYVGVTTSAPSPVAHTPEEFAAKLDAFAAAEAEAHGHTAAAKAITSHDPSIDLNDTLLNAATDLGADLIVIASHIPTLADHLWPSHGGQIAKRATASVFVVR